MSVGKRLRFEVLKRDGFRCRYCGASSMDTPLHVDHVVATSEGGSDDPSNLVAACEDCNLGKSNKAIDSCALPQKETGAEALERAGEHVAQIKAYLAAQQEVEAARQEVVDWLADKWTEIVGNDPPKAVYTRFRGMTQQHPLVTITDAMGATAAAAWQMRGDALRETKYFHACLRSISESEREAKKRSAEVDVLLSEACDGSAEDRELAVFKLAKLARMTRG